MSYTLIEHNDDFVVINKEPGVQVQKPQHTAEGASGLLLRVASDLQLSKLFPVHRLDEPTSGLLVMAKNEAANRELSLAFAERRVQKFYLAISDRKPAKKQGAIIGDMMKARGGNWKLLKTRSNPAITQFFSYAISPGQRVFVLKPHTGKTHQLRVVMKSLGAPIIGDLRYGGAKADRLYLHALALIFPWQGSLKHYRAMPGSGERFLSSEIHHLLEGVGEVDALPWPELRPSGCQPEEA